MVFTFEEKKKKNRVLLTGTLRFRPCIVLLLCGFLNIPASFQTTRSQNSNACLTAHMHVGLIFLEEAS